MSSVVVKNPSYTGGSANSVNVTLSWAAPTSGGAAVGYRVRHQQRWSGSCTGGSQSWIEASVTSRSTVQKADTQCGSSWIVWQVAAVNKNGVVGPYTTATGVLPDVAGLQWSYHLVRAVGGKAVYGGTQDCGAALYAGCSTNPGAGTSISAGTQVGVVQETGS